MTGRQGNFPIINSKTMRKRILFGILTSFVCIINICAQQREFSKWDATAFCSYTRYHPFTYIKADNNWEIIQALRTPHTRLQLDSLGIKNTASQMMLLRIEGLVERNDRGDWVTIMPILDSLETVEARTFSLLIAKELYKNIKYDCTVLTTYLQQENQQENIYSILFSYVLDSRIWKSFNEFNELKTSATWEGECWALYFPRKFSCGSNTYYNEFTVCWTENQPDFIGRELDSETFIKPFLDEYNQYGKITSQNIFNEALKLGIVHKDGSVNIPVIDSKDSNSPLNIISDQIITKIVRHFTDSDIIAVFQERFNLNQHQKKLACTMLYHEVMWDLMDLLTDDKIIQHPIVWKNMNKQSTSSVVFIQK